MSNSENIYKNWRYQKYLVDLRRIFYYKNKSLNNSNLEIRVKRSYFFLVYHHTQTNGTTTTNLNSFDNVIQTGTTTPGCTMLVFLHKTWKQLYYDGLKIFFQVKKLPYRKPCFHVFCMSAMATIQTSICHSFDR